MSFQVGDKVAADDRQGYTIPDGVVIGVVPEDKWPYDVQSEKGGPDWPFSEDELTAR